METEYMLSCGLLWRKAADPDAGWALLDALASPDPELRRLARDMLIQRRESAMALLESAIETGALSPESAGPFMVALFRANGTDSALFTVSGEA